MPDIASYSYIPNPDSTVNSYGKKLLQLCKNNNIVLVNGLKFGSRSFDSDFTFYRGRVKSPNDWCASNYIKCIQTFKILPKTLLSDHTPIEMKIRISSETSFELLKDISAGTFSYETYDRSKNMRSKLTIENVNTDNLKFRLDNVADYITENLERRTELNNLSAALNDRLYDACRKITKSGPIRIPNDLRNLNSQNFRAIAEANLMMYIHSIQREDPGEQSDAYYNIWRSNLEYAIQKEKEEYNEKINVSWRSAAKNNPKKLWEMINYNESNKNNISTAGLDERAIYDYFSNIFQSKKIIYTPTIADIKNSLEEYFVYIPVLDDDFTIAELNLAIQKNGKGFGLDRLDKRIANLFTIKLRSSIINLFNCVFSSCYPSNWSKQLLRPEKKKGHSVKDPKLRGVAISQMLPTLYDIMLFNRFNLWYTPNAEQAGFRPKQGCILQIFVIYIIMDYLKSLGEYLYVGFLDYEKAFDFVNRANIIKHLREKGAGSRYVKAIANMYEETSYIPKICNKIGNAIVAKHGVTQGRQTSTSFFSFEVQDMPKNVDITLSILHNQSVI